MSKERVIVLSKMNNHTGDYANLMVTEAKNARKDLAFAKKQTRNIFRLEVFVTGELHPTTTYYTIEDFFADINAIEGEYK